jgi:hypothetical protein
MKRESKVWIYFLLQVLEQLQRQAKEIPGVIHISEQELETIKEELFELTVEQTVDGGRLSDEELRKEVLSQLPLFLNDKKRFRLKEDLVQFAKKLGIDHLKSSHTITHMIGALLLEAARQDRPFLEQVLHQIEGKEPSSSPAQWQKQTQQAEEDESAYTWMEFFNYQKK